MKSPSPSIPLAPVLAALLVAAALLLVPGAVAQSPAVEQFTIASGSNSTRPVTSAAAFTPEGDVLVLWQSKQRGIEARRFAAAGAGSGGAGLGPIARPAVDDYPTTAPFSGEVTVHEEPVLLALPGDGASGPDYLALWQRERQYLTVSWFSQNERVLERTLEARRIDENGRPQGPPLAVTGHDPARGFDSSPRAALLADGRVVVVWQARLGRRAAGVYGRVIDSRGLPDSDIFRIDDHQGTDGAAEVPAVAALADGGFVVTWQECCDAGDTRDVVARRFDADGLALDAPFPVPVDPAGPQVWPAVAAGPDGNLLVAWMGAGDPESTEGREWRIHGQRLAADGTRLGEPLVLSRGTARAHGAPTLAPLPDGYALVWTLWGQHFLRGVAGVALDAEGAPRSDAVDLASTTVQTQWELTLATDAEGRCFAAWQGFSPAGDPSVNAWHLEPRHPEPLHLESHGAPGG